MWKIEKDSDYSYWLQDEHLQVFPADFLSRDAAEVTCILLNREARSRIEGNQEPIRVVLDLKPRLTPKQTQPSTRITLQTGYSKPKDRALTVTAHEESAPAPAPKTKTRITI
jgi:hypothetical protein